MIKERLRQLREKMEERGIDIYVVPTSDFHESEYVGEHFKARKFITGFTGSAGTAVITKTEAGLWPTPRRSNGHPTFCRGCACLPARKLLAAREDHSHKNRQRRQFFICRSPRPHSFEERKRDTYGRRPCGVYRFWGSAPRLPCSRPSGAYRISSPTRAT